jgi:hypothetical protein
MEFARNKPDRTTNNDMIMEAAKVAKKSDGTIWIATAVGLVAVAFATHGSLVDKAALRFIIPVVGEHAHENKPFRTVSDFYPFYLTEHRHPVSRALHVMGTTFVIGMTIAQYRQQIPNIMISLAVGSMLCEILSPLAYGTIEFVSVMGLIMLLPMVRGQRIPWKLPLVGYFLAWLGHFVWEKNQPATFIYPTYSLVCDIFMWFQTLTGQLSMTKHL